MHHLIVTLSNLLVHDIFYHLVELNTKSFLEKLFDSIVLFCAFITWHIVYTNGLLKMLVVCHHLREERALNNTHHRWLFLVVGLNAGRETQY